MFEFFSWYFSVNFVFQDVLCIILISATKSVQTQNSKKQNPCSKTVGCMLQKIFPVIIRACSY